MLQTTRRAFLRKTAIGAGAAAGAAYLAACEVGTTAPAPGTNGTGGTTTDRMNQSWETRATQLEANGVYSAADPGIWAGKEGTHVPTLTISGTTATVSATHGMAEEHWITTVYVRDQDGYVVFLQELIARGTGAATEATATFTVPATATSLTAYAYCNLHDCWSSVAVPVS